MSEDKKVGKITKEEFERIISNSLLSNIISRESEDRLARELEKNSNKFNHGRCPDCPMNRY